MSGQYKVVRAATQDLAKVLEAFIGWEVVKAMAESNDTSSVLIVRLLLFKEE